MLQSRYGLLAIYSAQQDRAKLQKTADDIFRIVPNDAIATRYLKSAPAVTNELARLEQLVRSTPTPEGYLNLSMLYYQNRRYEDSLAAAQAALKLRPEYAEAWNNMAAAYQSLRHWDEAIQAAQQALRINPNYQLAKNNLAWAEQQKKAAR
jgi:tetratricopeptide (TPR) repeat protein